MTFLFEPCSDVITTAPDVSDPNYVIWAAADCDGDGLSNGTEIATGTDPNDPCDYDASAQNINNVSPLWLAADCDGDGVSNGTEINDGTNPQNPCDYLIVNQDITIVDAGWLDADCDGDGEDNGTELTNGTDPLDPCSVTNPTIPATTDANYDLWAAEDCDGDGEPNGVEVTNGTDPFNPCDGGDLANVDLMNTTSDWYNADCDGDGVTNGTEVDPDMDGNSGPNNTDPNDACDFNMEDITEIQGGAWNNADCDGDGVSNEDELISGTDPLDPCSYFESDITLPKTAITVCTPEIEVTKTAVTSGENIGDTITYTIEVENTGNVVLNEVEIEDTLVDATGNPLTLTTEPVFINATFNSLEGVLLPGEIASYTATYVIEAGAINAGGVSNTVFALGIGSNNAELVSDVSDDGDDFDGNSSDDPTVTPLGCLTVFNEFSPNGDGVNDTFVINCIENYPNNTLEIYNRWGNIVYSKKGYNNDFDGTSNGRAVLRQSEKLPVGTYYYVLNLGDGSEARVDWLYINR